MATVQNITDAAYRKCGLRSPDSTESAEALEALNNMISLWGLSFLVPYVTREAFDLEVGKRTYTIGTDGDFNTVRPLMIANVFLRSLENYDYSVRIISAKSYDAITMKDLSKRPLGLYYIPECPLGSLRFSSKPEAVYSARFEFWKNLTEFASLNTTVALPNEYKEALVYNLSIKLAEENSIALSQTVIETARSSLVLLSRNAVINRLPAIIDLGFGSSRPTNIVTGE